MKSRYRIASLENNPISLMAIFTALCVLFTPLYVITISGRSIFIYLEFIAIIYGLFYSIIKKNLLRVDLIILLQLLLFLFQVASISWAINHAQTTLMVYNYLKFALIFIFLSFFYFNEREVVLIRNSYAFGSFIASLIIISNIHEYYRATLEFGDVSTNTDYLSFFLFVPTIECLWYLIFVKGKVFSKIILLIFSAVSIFALFATGSKAGILVLSLVIIVFILLVKFKNRNFKIKRKFFISFVLLGLIVSIFIMLRYNTLPEYTRLRLKNFFGNIDNGRIILWSSAINYNQSILRFSFGSGFGSTPVILGMTAHNLFIDAFISTGIIGLGFYAIYLIILMKKIIKSNLIYPYVIFIGTLFLSLVLSSQYSRFLYCNLFIIYIEIKKRKNLKI